MNANASNDNAASPKRSRLALPTFRATLIADSIAIADGDDGRPAMVLKGCAMTLPGGSAPVARDVAVSADAYETVAAAMRAGRDVVATLRSAGATATLLGVTVDGVTTSFEAPVPLAA